jgi:hypothetical protein
MRFQAGIQITLLVIAIVIAFSVLKPKIESIRSEQNQLDSYKAALENIGLYNQRLQTLINEADAISPYDKEVLWRYLPEEVDATAVARDVANIVSQNGLILLDVVPNPPAPLLANTTSVADAISAATNPIMAGVVAPTNPSSAGVLTAQQFQVEVIGTYDEMKSMLRDLERNAYPLRLIKFEFSLEEDPSLVQYSLLLETYALASS